LSAGRGRGVTHRRLFRRHITLGHGVNVQRCAQIYFDVAGDGRIELAWVGEHQPTQARTLEPPTSPQEGAEQAQGSLSGRVSTPQGRKAPRSLRADASHIAALVAHKRATHQHGGTDPLRHAAKRRSGPTTRPRRGARISSRRVAGRAFSEVTPKSNRSRARLRQDMCTWLCSRKSSALTFRQVGP